MSRSTTNLQIYMKLYTQYTWRPGCRCMGPELKAGGFGGLGGCLGAWGLGACDHFFALVRSSNRPVGRGEGGTSEPGSKPVPEVP